MQGVARVQVQLAQVQQRAEAQEEDLQAASSRAQAGARVAALLEAELARTKAALAALQQSVLEQANSGTGPLSLRQHDLLI